MWKLSDWIFLMEPYERIWFWWGTHIIDDTNNYFVFSTNVLDDPFLSGGIKWLFKGCGAIDVIDEDDF